MAKKVTEIKFVSNDGKEFDSEDEAQRHEKLAEARTRYESSRQEFSRALFETQKTADGENFKFCIYDYYWVNPAYGGWPRIEQVSFIGWNFDIDDNDELSIRTQQENSDPRWKSYRISELYWNKKNAQKAWIEAMKERIADKQEEIERASANS